MNCRDLWDEEELLRKKEKYISQRENSKFKPKTWEEWEKRKRDALNKFFGKDPFWV